jgi:hypothetical protein
LDSFRWLFFSRFYFRQYSGCWVHSNRQNRWFFRSVERNNAHKHQL